MIRSMISPPRYFNHVLCLIGHAARCAGLKNRRNRGSWLLLHKNHGKIRGCLSGGASVSGASGEIKHYLGLALVPQAGVSIGLAVLGQRLLPAEMGSLLSTIILSSAVLYEMVGGPASGKLALHLAGAIPRERNEKRDTEAVESEEIASDSGLLRVSGS